MSQTIETGSIRVPGTEFDIQLNSVYQIVEKSDLRGAPEGYNKLGFTKVPSYEITTTVHAKFDNKRGIWDTGLDETSSVYNGMDSKEKNAILKELTSVIINPLLKYKPKDFLNPHPKPKGEVIRDKDYNGLENHAIVLGIDRFFDTSNPVDLFNLFTVIYKKDLCPKDQEMNPEYIQADFCVVNDAQKINTTEEKQYKKDKAVSKLISKWEKDKKKALEILKYCGVAASLDSSEQTVVAFFRKWLDDKSDRGGNNSEYFLDRVENFEDERGSNELYIYTQLQKMFDKKEVTVRNGEYFLNSKSLGNSLKIYAETASKDDELMAEIIGEK